MKATMKPEKDSFKQILCSVETVNSSNRSKSFQSAEFLLKICEFPRMNQVSKQPYRYQMFSSFLFTHLLKFIAKTTNLRLNENSRNSGDSPLRGWPNVLQADLYLVSPFTTKKRGTGFAATFKVKQFRKYWKICKTNPIGNLIEFSLYRFGRKIA